MTMALAGLMFGCGDDSNPGTGGSGSSSDTGTSTSTTTTTGADSSSGIGSGSVGSGESSSSTGDPIEVTVEGTVRDFLLMQPIANTEISVYDDPAITATADDEGFFSIGTFQPNTGALFLLAPSKEYWGAVIPIDIGPDPLQEDTELTQISQSIIDMQIEGLMAQMPEPANLDEAIIIARLRNPTAIMEGPTTIDMTPAPVPGTYYAPDAAGAPVLDQNTIEFVAIPVVVFFNIPDSEPGTITFEASHPTRDCTVLYPDLPTIGQHITLVEIECLPPE